MCFILFAERKTDFSACMFPTITSHTNRQAGIWENVSSYEARIETKTLDMTLTSRLAIIDKIKVIECNHMCQCPTPDTLTRRVTAT